MSTRSPRSFAVALLGQGVGPSLTPELHEREGARQGFRYAYKLVDLSDDQLGTDHLASLLAFSRELGLDGLNVTHPIKQVIAPLVPELSPAAAAIGAVNTVTFADGVTTGHNTDVTGFAASFRVGLPGARTDRVLILGAGGAGTAIAHALAQAGATALCVSDPDSQRVADLVASVSAHYDLPVEAVAPDGVAGQLRDATGLVNASPVGMAAYPGTPFPVDALHRHLWVVDIVYRPLTTALLTAARDAGCQVLSGAGMAVHQAADAFELITGSVADRAAMTADFDDLVAHEHRAPTERPADGGPGRAAGPDAHR